MHVTYHPHGDLDRTSVDAFQLEICAAIDRTTEAAVVVDFSDVQFMDSAAFEVLEQCGNYAIERGHELVVSSLRTPYALMLHLLPCSRVVAIATDEAPRATACRRSPSGGNSSDG